MKFISWNVNGLRASLKKGLLDFLQELDGDFIALQELRLHKGQLDFQLEAYHSYWSYSDQAAYAGLLVLSRRPAQALSLGMGPDCPYKARIMTLDYGDFYLVNLQAPNSQRDLVNLAERLDWDRRLRDHLARLRQDKELIVAGDFNLAHGELDLKNPRINENSPGFSQEERQSFDKILGLGLVDSFRSLNPDLPGAYSWWSYMRQAKDLNVGWRMDYFLVGDRIRILDAKIHSRIEASDHCPIELVIEAYKKTCD